MKSKIYSFLLLVLFGTASLLKAQNTCPTPTGMITSAITSNSATLNWNVNTTGGYYKIQYHPVGMNPVVWTQFYAQTNSYTVSGLTCGTAYEWQVQSICAASGTVATTSPFSAGSSFTTLTCATTCTIPSGLATSAIAGSSASASWTAVSGAIAYRIQYRIINGPPATWTPITVTTPYCTLQNLVCGTGYEWQVQTLCNTTANGSSAFSASSIFTTNACPVPCPVPTSLAASAITASSATLTWLAATPSPANYVVQYHVVNTSTYTTVNVLANQSLSLSNLACNTTYEWKVKTICSPAGVVYDSSAFSAGSSFTTLACQTTCAAPTALTSANVTATSASLAWTAPGTTPAYLLQYHIVNTATWTSVTIPSNQSYTLTGLLCGSTYEWKVQSLCSTTNSGGISAFSATSIFTTSACQINCAAPTALSSSNVTTTSAYLAWTAPSTTPAYLLQYHLVNTATWTSVTIPSNQSYTLTGLLCGSTYEWKVQSLCSTTTSGGISAFSATSTFTTSACQIICAAPTALTSSNVTATSAYLAWTAPSTTPAYLLQYHLVNTTTWTSVTISANQSYTLTGLLCGSTYEWKVQSLCSNTVSGGISAFSATSIFTTSACTSPCLAPTGLSSSAIASNSAVLTWVAPAGVVYYKVQYRPVNLAISTWTQFTVTAGTTFSASNLQCGTGYEWQVQSLCSNVPGTTSSSAFTNSSYFTTLPCSSACVAPSGLAVSGISTSNATLTWTAVAGVSVYNVQYRILAGAILNWTQTTVQGTSITLNSLACGSPYEWQVASVCNPTSGSTSISSYAAGATFSTATCVNTCPVPTGLTSGAITSNSVYVGWQVAPGALYYVIQYRSILPNVPPTNPWTQQIVQGSNTQTLINLFCNTNYEWQVQSICSTASGGSSNFSASAFFTTAVCAATCAAPTGLFTSNITPSSALIKWNGIAGSVLYNIRYRLLNGTIWYSASSTTLSKVLSNLNIQSYYEWQVQALCPNSGTTSGTWSPWSASSYFHTHFVVSITPNPANRFIKLEVKTEVDEEAPVRIELRNILGAVVYRSDEKFYAGINQFEIATADLKEGLYFLSVSGNSGNEVTKVYVKH